MSLLITEMTEEVNAIVEEAGADKKYFVEGVIMQSEVQNKNGRIYPKGILEREVMRFTNEKIKGNRAYGELNHPQGPTINLDRVSHMFTELNFEGNNVIGRAKVLGTPMGTIVKSLIDEGANLGISSRGMGTLKKNKNGIMEIQEDFHLATAGDIVADPSAPNAFVRGVMEGVEWVYDVASSSWRTAQVFDAIEQTIKQTAHKSTKQLEEQAVPLFKRFIESL